MSNGTIVLLVENCCHMAQSGTRLDSCNVLLRVIGNIVHIRQLNDQVTVLSTEAET